MKTPKLFELIKSLNSQETAYISRILGSYTGASKTRQLFLEIKKQKKYDETLLKRLIYGKTEVVTKKFMVLKNQLYKLVLGNMVTFHAGSSVDQELRNQLSAAEFLLSKGLHNHCYNKLKEAKRQAETYEKRLYMIQINRMETALSLANLKMDELKTITGSYLTEQRLLLEKEANCQQYENIECQLFYLMYRSGESIPDKITVAQLEGVLNTPLMKDEFAAISFEARTLFHNILCSFNFFMKDFTKANIHAANLVAHLETHKAAGDYKTQKSYMIALSNLLLCQIFLIKRDESIITINKLKKLQKNYPKLSAEIFKNVVSSEIEMYSITGSIEEGLKLISEIEEGLKYYKGKIRNHEETLLFFRISVFLFIAGDHRQALKWINRILNYDNINPHDEVMVPAKILSLIIHYELGNIELVESILKSLAVIIRKNQKSPPLELNILRCLKKVITTHSPSELINIFRRAKTVLISLTGNDKLIQWKSIEYLYLIPWIESKIQNRPLPDIMRERAKGV